MTSWVWYVNVVLHVGLNCIETDVQYK
jgi:hypothetical protein